MKKKREFPIHKMVHILDVAAEGKCIAKIEDLILFVSQVVPGDIVDVQVNIKKKNYQEGHPIFFHKYSEDRAVPFCKHFGVCGGCKWQDLPYDKQLIYKQKQVSDQFRHIGKLEIPEQEEIVASEHTQYYRNKLEYTFCTKRWLTRDEIKEGEMALDMRALGFHIPRMFDRVLQIDTCYLQPTPSNEIRNAVYEYAIKNEIDFYDLREHKGFLRNMIIRNSTSGEVMLILIFQHDDPQKRIAILDYLSAKFPQITSLMYMINGKRNDSVTDLEAIPYRGNDFIIEKMEGLKFKIGPKSFYQTNPEQAYNLYKIARDYAQLEGYETVYDLYTGTGTIANFIAKNAKKVIGLEYVPEAIEDAILNSKINGIENTEFYAGDMKNILTQAFVTEKGFPDVMIIDPPRAGMHEDVIKTILFASPKRIIYVSCNPATQARDINLLSTQYKLIKFRPVDMFPHTFHVENVALLQKIV